MTENKPIIDKVNIKKCKYYYNGKCERYEEFVEADYANYSVKCICEKENDLGTYDICDYQQLVRKTQECEKLKKDRINIIKENSKDYRKLQQSEQKLERIEEYCKEQNLKADYTACEILQIIEE